MSTDTKPRATIMLCVTAQCPSCNKRLEVEHVITAEEFESSLAERTMILDRLDSMHTEVEVAKAGRGWTLKQCGSCRDKD